MTVTMHIKRFSISDRLFHLFLMLTFIIQTATGLGRLFVATAWGKQLNAVFGGYENSLSIHKWVGVLMLVGFLIHTLFQLTRLDWKNPVKSILGPDSLVPNLQDLKDFVQQIKWLFGIGSRPALNRWAYWEKFDYWAVYWGLPLLAVTGLMLTAPLLTSRFFPGWILNITALLHRAEAILAITYIFIVHFFIGHLRPSSFPMNEAMFSGSVSVDEAEEEKPAWVDRLRKQGKLENAEAVMPPPWFRVIYFIFGYTVLIIGVYLLINGIINSRYITLH
ncbi:cytochrome C [Desulfococcus multivorans]|jgi:formate dehydrogenase gamma subunit|uniref:Di-heme cytochrome, transmembrane n=2 Tax=Desulfococcaceae TaxID=2931039 RepID=S7V9F4_DESML|nr:cytochrome b/b6 domain-containing protein [Desulfococcus multivorans]AQV02466.1 cytochrome C [Desulfococcus multivorans]EPR41148.1 Di-heme cytochrome, transmembrane [Desulfococcus multivorans DSM 2059]SJZ59714.1 formate dehydrogenase, gamma subunit [Desulfococcus multivorans DSM 2059]